MPPIPSHFLVRRAMMLGLVTSALTLAGCDPGNSPPGAFSFGQPAPAPVSVPAAPAGEVLGTGTVKVAMILPNSAGGQSSGLATQLTNAAKLALADFPGADIQISVKDDAGTTEGGEAAAAQAVGEGAQLIIGPLNAVSARGVAGPARQAGVPIVTFTTDSSVATRGVYLIGFLPSADVERIVAHAAAQGRRSYAAMVPDDAYGAIAEATFRQAAAQAGVRVLAIERYREPSEIQVKAATIAKLGGQIDAVFVPDAPANASLVVQALISAGMDKSRVKILGTSRWNDPIAFNDQNLAGAWYPSADPGPIEAFKLRYRQTYGAEPAALAVLGYETVFLAAGLVRTAGPQPFREEILLSRNGFFGKTGLFRFRPDGTSERGLAVFELGGSTPKIVGPAPKQFTQGT